MISQYSKSLSYILVAVLMAVVAPLSDGILTLPEGINLGVVALGAIGIYLVPNIPESYRSYSKGGIAFLTAIAVTLVSVLSGGITGAEVAQIALAAFGAIGVVIIPNTVSVPLANQVAVPVDVERPAY